MEDVCLNYWYICIWCHRSCSYNYYFYFYKHSSVKKFSLLFPPTPYFSLSFSLLPPGGLESSTVSNISLLLHLVAQLIWKDFILLSSFLSFGYYIFIMYSYSSLWSLFLSFRHPHGMQSCFVPLPASYLKFCANKIENSKTLKV